MDKQQINNDQDNSHGFLLESSQFIAALGITMEAYRHERTGALHIHLASANDENVFMVALRTVPTDDTGVAHILEHTVLCGSERFPVRDPFFMMLRRSLNTFMNAFTSSDWTAYPFASKNKKDFENLLSVYLDAVFFSRLDHMDFAQEGHRLAFSEPDNTDSDLNYQGVVFNEMKGAMSSPTSVLWQKMTHHLYPNSTYHFNSGGEPEAIPDLSYEALQAFYQKHYHPSNAIFLTFGDLPASWHHERFEHLVLSRFDRGEDSIAVQPEPRFPTPKTVVEAYAIEETKAKTYHVLSWVLDDVCDFKRVIEAQLVTGVLLDHSASPLLHVLETSSLGTGPAPISGLSDDQRTLSFACGIEGSEPDQAQAVEALILETLESIADKGVPLEDCESALRQIELSQREIGGGSYPYGLQLVLKALPAAIHRGDPVDFLDIDAVLKAMRQAIQDPEFVPGLIRRLFLDNPHRVLLSLVPDATLAEKKVADEKAKLAVIKNEMDDAAKKQLVEQSKKLAARQTMEEDLSILPNLTRSDIPHTWSLAHGERFTVENKVFHGYEQPCNGLVYQDIVVHVPNLPHWNMLPWFDECFTELGCGDLDYKAMQARQYGYSGGIDSSLTIVSDHTDAQIARAHFSLSGKALLSQGDDLTHLLWDTLTKVRFDEPQRIKDVLLQLVASERRSITGQGHTLAMLAAHSVHHLASNWQHHLFGLQGIANLITLEQSIDERLPELMRAFQAQHEALLTSSRDYLVVAEPSQLQDRIAQLATVAAASPKHDWLNLPNDVSNEFDFKVPHEQFWVADTQVNFCAKAYPTVGMTHTDCAPLKVLALILRNGYCHRAIREQGGAYGGGAVQGNHCLKFYSYRDPRLSETLADFDRAVAWVLDRKLTASDLEEAILGLISQFDKPSSPVGEARKAFYSLMEGCTESMQRQVRDNILAVTLEDVYRVAETYLKPEQASTAVISHAQALDAYGDLGMQVFSLV